MTKPILIIGVGNYLMSDEGAGVHAVKRLEKNSWPEDVEIIDAATAGLSLLHIIEDRKFVIIIDCADFGGKAGEVRIFNPDDLKTTIESQASLHAIDLLSVLELARKMNKYPEEVKIIGIQPEKIDYGTSLSPSVEKALADVEKLVQKLVHEVSLRA